MVSGAVMRKLSAALLIYFGLASAALAQTAGGVPATMYSVPITISTATTTLLATGIPGKSIYITHADVVAGGTGSIQFIAGTGATCGTSTVNLTGAYNLVAQVGFVIGTGYGAVIVAPKGFSICAVTSAAVAMPGTIAYAIY